MSFLIVCIFHSYSYTAGIDGIPSFILKDSASILAFSFFHIYNFAKHTSGFPKFWNKAYKYGPISFVCDLLGAILTRIFINASINAFLSRQHGFMHDRSTVTNLAHLSQFVLKKLDKRDQEDFIYKTFKSHQTDYFVIFYKLEFTEFTLSFRCSMLAFSHDYYQRYYFEKTG